MICVKCRAPLERIDLGKGVSLESCPVCHGAFYEDAELALRLEPQSTKDSGLSCPRCGKEMQRVSLYRDGLLLERCEDCRGYWFDVREIDRLRKLSGKEQILAGARRASNDRDADTASYINVPDSSTLGEDSWGPVKHFENRTYKHFQTAKAVVTYVLGEFYWRVKVGDQAVVRDFVCPPYLLSQERTQDESVWTHGEYLEPEEVWAAFKQPGAPPARRGVAPAQPNPRMDAHRMLNWFGALAVGAVVVYAAFSAFSQKKVVHESSHVFYATLPEKSFVTPEFELTGRKSNVKVDIETNVHNRWAYFSMALINSDTGEALDFGREVAYYWDDEPWGEGSPKDSVYLPPVRSGRYYLRVEPESDAGAVAYKLRVTRDAPRPGLLLLALLALALPLPYIWMRYWMFEVERWNQSDHAISIDAGGEDDE